MTRQCQSGDLCDEPATMSVSLDGPPRWCARHAAQLQAIADTMRRPARKKTPPKPAATASGRADLNALKLAQLVADDIEPVSSGLPAKLGLTASSAGYKAAVEIALAAGYVTRLPGRGFIPGDAPLPEPIAPPTARLPKRARRLLAVEHARAAGTPLTRSELERAAGLTQGSGTRVLELATAEGWLVRSGNGPATRYTVGVPAPAA